MADGPTYKVPMRRRREGRTDYRRRLGLLKGRTARVVVRKTLNNVTVQFVEFSDIGDRVVAQATARELSGMGYKGHTGNTSAAYLTGLLAGKRAQEAGTASGVLDLGLQVPSKGGAIFGALAGVVDSGVEVPHGNGMVPDDGRLRGEHAKNHDAAAFASVYEKIAGKPLPAKREVKKAKPAKPAAAAPVKGGAKGGKPAAPAPTTSAPKSAPKKDKEPEGKSNMKWKGKGGDKKAKSPKE